MKTKFCEEGQHEVPNLFLSRKPNRPSCCYHCAKKYAKPIGNGVKMVQSDHTSNKPLKSTQIRTPINKVSNAEKKRQAAYKVARKEYLATHPTCEAQIYQCTGIAEHVHHKKGRIGTLLIDARYFLACCHNCHEWVEHHPKEAKMLGFSLSRLIKE